MNYGGSTLMELEEEKRPATLVIMIRVASNTNIIVGMWFGKLSTVWSNLDIQQKRLLTAYMQYMERAQASQTS